MMLTSYDALAAEILYPKPGQLPLACDSACLLTGEGALVRNHGRLRDSWSARGANPWWDANILDWADEHASYPSQPTCAPGLGRRYITYMGHTKYAEYGNDRIIMGGGWIDSDHAQWTGLALAYL
jgi:hypothetical protein